MSGGSYEYAYCKLQDLAESVITRADHQPIRREIARILNAMANICHDVEWIDSCDYGEDEWANVEKALREISGSGIDAQTFNWFRETVQSVHEQLIERSKPCPTQHP